MNFPVNAIADLLRNGLLLIREKAITDPAACEIEADHLHNLPTLLENHSLDLLRYYYNIERQDYLSRCRSEPAEVYMVSWQMISAYLDEIAQC